MDRPAGRQQQPPPPPQQQQPGHPPSSAAALHDGLPGHSRQPGGGLISIDPNKQRAVRDWALRRLEFDRSLEEREGGVVVGELRSAFAAETGVRVGHKDQWCDPLSLCARARARARACVCVCIATSVD